MTKHRGAPLTVLPRVNRSLPKASGGSWWVGHPREHFTACALKRFPIPPATFPFIEDANVPRARGRYRPKVAEPISSYTFNAAELSEIAAHSDGVESPTESESE